MESTPAPPSAFLSTADLAALLDLKPQTLRKKRLTGDGPPYVRLGAGPAARVVYRRSDVEEWLASHTFKSTSAETVASARS
ncbi:MAG: helix-turn-helix transcriptional regulator [Myxococcota bacterium]